jgi:hypothetical protein
MKTNNTIPTTPKRARAFDQKFLSARTLAKRWDLSLSAVYHGDSDVARLKKISFGRSIRFVLKEVEAVEDEKITGAS